MAEGNLIKQAQVTWANSAPQNTTKDIDVAVDVGEGDSYEIVVRNPSTVTALTVRAKVKEATDATFGGGADRYPVVQTFAAGVPANSPEGVVLTVLNWEIGGEPGRVTLSNDTVLGVADGFTADVRVRKIA